MEAFLISTGLVAIAEIGDKTMLLAIALAATWRRPVPIILGILVVPTIASVSEDALSSVPQALREGAFGLGAAKWQVVVRVVFPAALSGVVAGLVLGASRAIGETVLILVAAGNNPNLNIDLGIAHQNMAAFIANTARLLLATSRAPVALRPKY